MDLIGLSNAAVPPAGRAVECRERWLSGVVEEPTPLIMFPRRYFIAGLLTEDTETEETLHRAEAETTERAGSSSRDHVQITDAHAPHVIHTKAVPDVIRKTCS